MTQDTQTPQQPQWDCVCAHGYHEGKCMASAGMENGAICGHEQYESFIDYEEAILRITHLEGALREAEQGWAHVATQWLTAENEWAGEKLDLEAKLREAEAKAALFDLVMDALPDSYASNLEGYSDWRIEIPQAGYQWQYLGVWVEDYKRALQQPKAGA